MAHMDTLGHLINGQRVINGGRTHDVFNPALDDNDFDAAVRTAQPEYDQHQPDVIVGSSRGGAGRSVSARGDSLPDNGSPK